MRRSLNAELIARARPLGPAYDLLAAYLPFEAPAGSVFFERAGLGIAGSGGHAIRVPAGPDQISIAAERAHRALSRIRGDKEGPAPLVAGGLSFDGRAPAELRLLSPCAIRIEAGRTWRVEVRTPSETDLFFTADDWGVRPHPLGPAEEFDAGQLVPDPEPAAYELAVDEATRRIRAGALRKVVLARTLAVRAGRQLDPRTLLWRLRAVDPDCFTFAIPTSRGVLVGASPELLVSRSGLEVRATPLAGSSPRFGDPEEDVASAAYLLDSPKEREEHAIVVDAVAKALSPFCEELAFADAPTPLATANVWHLATSFRGRLRLPAPTALELVAALHPTPAVCGHPREAALGAIAGLEGFDRGCYAGPVGWVDADGDGEWALALRCAELRGSDARLFAGAGIVADSDPARELDETDRKFRALLDSMRWS
jgi:isochorismate synthase